MRDLEPCGTVDYGPLASSIGFLLRLAQVEAFDRFYADDGAKGVRLGELSILLMIRQNPGLRQGVLGGALRIKRAHMTKIVRALEGAGLIRGSVPDSDRRAVELWLTDAGRARVQSLWARMQDAELGTPDGLTPREAETLRHLLQKLLRIDAEGKGAQT